MGKNIFKKTKDSRGKSRGTPGKRSGRVRRNPDEKSERIKEQLAESQRLARLGSWTWDIPGNKVTWSDELYRVFGLKPGEFRASYEGFLERVHPDDRERVDEIIRSALKDHKAIDYYHRTIRPDGAVRILHCMGRLAVDENGNAIKMFGTAQDVTEGKLTEGALAHSKAQFEAIFNSILDAVIFTDTERKILMVNPAAEKMFGYSFGELAGMTTEFLYADKKDFEDVGKRRFSPESENGQATLELQLRRRDGSIFPAEVTGSKVRDPAGNIIGFLGIARDITERKKMEEFIRYHAFYDMLTGLPNRTLFIDHLTLAVRQAHRERRMIAVVYVDLDRFKSINDSLGHAVGDQLLKAVADLLKTAVPEANTIARIGGDEYSLLLPQVSREDDVLKVVKRIIADFKRPLAIGSRRVHISASVGISIFPNDGGDAESLLRNADIAMSQVKERGGNNYQFYNTAMNIRILERINLENSMRFTLEHGGFVLYYQPQVDMGTGRLTGVEALIRWRHPELGLLEPMQFIQLAEDTGLIVPIGEWVFRTACTQMKKWQKEGIPPLCVSVNLSAHQFQQPDLVEMISEILRETSLDSRCLDIEITESTAMQDIDITVPKLAELSSLGIRFAIDDFGTGYSSLSYLKRLPIQKLKIDKSFISGLTADPDYQAIVQAVIIMAHNLKLRVVAEGVETEEQLSFLRSSQCDEIQGYLFSKPLPPDEIDKLIGSVVSVHR